MTHRVYNFSPGPATLPLPVLQRVQEEFLDFQGMGASIVEISHRSPEFEALLGETDQLLREALALPRGYKILYCHGGGQMQFSMVPLNLIGLKPAHKALYVDTGNFAARAAEEGERYGAAQVVASSKASRYDHIPPLDVAALDPQASYLHITTNNTVEGTRWQQFPRANGIPLVGDATSEILGRVIDVGQFGLLYAAAQKNLGPPGLAVVLIREDLLGHAHPLTPKLLDYTRLAKEHSLTNTVNTFAVYTTKLVLEWLKTQGGVAEMEKVNDRKAALIYEAVDGSGGFYRPHAQKAHRSTANVTFHLPDAERLARFLKEALAADLYGLKGHAALGGVRASLYNGLPLAGARALADFMRDFQRRNG